MAYVNGKELKCDWIVDIKFERHHYWCIYTFFSSNHLNTEKKNYIKSNLVKRELKMEFYI